MFIQLTDILRGKVREQLARNIMPRVGIVDSQSVKTGEMGRIKGYDGAKKVKGRKRHIIVDSQGVLLTACVSRADENDRKGLAKLMEQLSAKGLALKKIFADMEYNGLPARTLVQQYDCELTIVQRPRKGFYVPEAVTDVAAYLKELGYTVSEGFTLLPKRWIVERTLAWFTKFRRLSKDCELMMSTSEHTLYLAMTWILVRRIAAFNKV